MPAFHRLITALLVFALVLAAMPANAAPRLTVFAAASLREAFSEIAQRFGGASHDTVRLDFGGSNALARQIVLGAPADVFASADARQMDVLRRAGKLSSPATAFARNRLVVIVPANGAASVASVRDLARPGIRVDLAAPEVPAGAYARTALAAMSRDARYGRRFEQRVVANVISFETDVKAVATKVALGEADAGIVYATDVAPIAAQVRAIPIPRSYAPPATYYIAVVRGASHPAEARRFVAEVQSGAGQAVLRRHGFLPAH